MSTMTADAWVSLLLDVASAGKAAAGRPGDLSMEATPDGRGVDITPLLAAANYVIRSAVELAADATGVDREAIIFDLRTQGGA